MPRKTADTLSQTQRLILAQAAHHAEQRVLCPDTIKPPTFRASLQILKKRGLIADMPLAEGKRGQQRSLIITPEGLAAIGITSPAPAAREDSAGSSPVSIASGKHQPSKQVLLISLLSQSEGATLDALAAATKWLPHTTRAALTRLRQRGVAILTVRAAGHSTRYRLAEQSSAASNEAIA